MKTALDSYSTLMHKMEELKLVPFLYEFVMEHGFIAGGAVRDVVRSKIPKDYDIFFKTEHAKNDFISKFGKSYPMTETGIGNFNFRDFQFITIRFGSPRQVIETFDWNVNMAFLDFATKKITVETTNNELHINCKSEKPLSALIRLPYMVQKGFRISEEEMLFAMTFVSTIVDLTNSESVAKQSEFMSSGGGLRLVSTITKRAVQAGVDQSPLNKALM
jgi:hypothetical protein